MLIASWSHRASHKLESYSKTVSATLRAKDIDLDNRRLWRLQDSQNAATVEHKPTGKRMCVASALTRSAPTDCARRSCSAMSPRNGLDLRAMPCSRHCGRRSARFQRSRLIALGTRPADPTHWFAKLLRGGADYCTMPCGR